MEANGLTKNEYVEVQDLIKREFAGMKTWLKETFVCKEHCGNRREVCRDGFTKARVGFALWGVALTIGMLYAGGLKTLEILKVIP